MTDSHENQWLVTYLEGDTRLQNKRHGILRLNSNERRIEFSVQTSEAQDAPFVVVSYPIKYLRTIKVIERRKKLKKKEFLELTFGDPPDVMHPIFSLSLDDPSDVKIHLDKFKDEMNSIGSKASKPESEIFELFSSLIMKPVEQIQTVVSDLSSQIRNLAKKPVEISRKFIPTEAEREIEIQKISLNNRIVRFYQSSTNYNTTLILLSPLGGKLEDLIPLLKSLRGGKFNTIILGIRGFTPPVEQDQSFKLKNYIQDLKDFIEFLGQNQKLVLGAHSILSAILIKEFFAEKYENIKKFILLSGIHRAPKTFRNGVKRLPPARMWKPFKGQVRKIAPKILFSSSTNPEIIESFTNHAFFIPDKVYSNIFRNFLPGFDYESELAKLNKPILTIWGQNDQLIPEKLRAEMEEKFQKSNFYFKSIDGGHMFFYETPDIIGRYICEFITSKRSSINIE
jgi:pimeloyl-ACP methyl ester carboxylesterase